MKKFKFSLQTLLNITISLEKQQKNKLAIINNELNLMFKQKENLLLQIQEMNDYYKKSLTVNEFINSTNYLKHLKEKVIRLNVEISIKENEKADMQKELIEIMTKRKTYEKLREKHLDIYKKELSLEDSKNLDDFISCNGGE